MESDFDDNIDAQFSVSENGDLLLNEKGETKLKELKLPLQPATRKVFLRSLGLPAKEFLEWKENKKPEINDSLVFNGAEYYEIKRLQFQIEPIIYKFIWNMFRISHKDVLMIVYYDTYLDEDDTKRLSLPGVELMNRMRDIVPDYLVRNGFVIHVDIKGQRGFDPDMITDELRIHILSDGSKPTVVNHWRRKDKDDDFEKPF
jgi:hypothetical protein